MSLLHFCHLTSLIVCEPASSSVCPLTLALSSLPIPNCPPLAASLRSLQPTVKERCYAFLADPKSSRAALAWIFFMYFLILVAITNLVLESVYVCGI